MPKFNFRKNNSICWLNKGPEWGWEAISLKVKSKIGALITRQRDRKEGIETAKQKGGPDNPDRIKRGGGSARTCNKPKIKFIPRSCGVDWHIHIPDVSIYRSSTLAWPEALIVPDYPSTPSLPLRRWCQKYDIWPIFRIFHRMIEWCKTERAKEPKRR